MGYIMFDNVTMNFGNKLMRTKEDGMRAMNTITK